MSKFINSVRHQQEFILKILLFVISAAFIIFFLPKEGKFKYEFQKNKPWVHEDLFAPYDFAINKSTEEIELEKSELKQSYLLYFNREKKIEQNSIEKYETWINKNWSDSLLIKGDKEKYLSKGEELLAQLFEIGIIQNGMV